MRPIIDDDDERGDHAELADDAPSGGATGGAGAGDDPAAGTAVMEQQSLPAPIPGVVSSVAVTTGQAVERGDELLTIEAMKMFNVIRSPWAGTVATVHVTEGKRVSQGEPLVTFRPT
jgi:biotin carboxyl carrier protein